MRKKPVALTPERAREWAEMAHLFFIDALTTTTPMALEQVAFHGGTNLHLSWGSPRYSEDLDFLVNRDFGTRITAAMPKIERRMAALAGAVDPDLRVTIGDRTRNSDGLLNFRIILSSPGVVGNVMAKAEFWQVDAAYLDRYETRFRRPVKSGDIVSTISQPIPAATLESAFADKVVALGYRPHLKWRDLFDLWWIQGQRSVDLADQIPAIMHNATAYRPDGENALLNGLQRFLERDPQEIVSQADPDLKRWLPRALWNALNPAGVIEIMEQARDTAREAIILINDYHLAHALPAAREEPEDSDAAYPDP